MDYYGTMKFYIIGILLLMGALFVIIVTYCRLRRGAGFHPLGRCRLDPPQYGQPAHALHRCIQVRLRGQELFQMMGSLFHYYQSR